jgi:hypothetical protein
MKHIPPRAIGSHDRAGAKVTGLRTSTQIGIIGDSVHTTYDRGVRVAALAPCLERSTRTR